MVCRFHSAWRGEVQVEERSFRPDGEVVGQMARCRSRFGGKVEAQTVVCMSPLATSDFPHTKAVDLLVAHTSPHVEALC